MRPPKRPPGPETITHRLNGYEKLKGQAKETRVVSAPVRVMGDAVATGRTTIVNIPVDLAQMNNEDYIEALAQAVLLQTPAARQSQPVTVPQAPAGGHWEDDLNGGEYWVPDPPLGPPTPPPDDYDNNG